jgi:probable F420-dependent oxidoreductase
MELGVQGFNSAPVEATAALARHAEDAGYGSWWAHDHVVLPTGADAAMNPRTPIVDPLVHLSHVAAVTGRMTLGTAVVILPQRNPLVLAKQAASLDALSGGRFVLGVGAGWLEPEMAAVGVPMAGRGARTDEYLDAMTALWTSPSATVHGRYVEFADVAAYPQPSGIRVVVGGRSPAAYRRAVARAHGLYGNGTPADIAADLEGLTRAAQEVERPARLGELEITAMPLTEADAGEPDRYAQLGVRRLVLRPPHLDDTGALHRWLDEQAP